MTNILPITLFCICFTIGLDVASFNRSSDKSINLENSLIEELVTRIETIDIKYGRQINILTDALSVQRQIVEATRAENEKLKAEVQHLRGLMEINLDVENRESGNMMGQIPKLSNYVMRARRDNGDLNDVAFTSRLQRHAVNLGVNETIVFDNVLTNVGNAYSAIAGVFVAPLDGTYVFSVTLVAGHRNNTHATFTINGDVVSNVFVDGFDNSFDSASQTIVLELTAKDEIAIKNMDDGKSITGDKHSLFTGFLLVQKYHETQVIG